MSVTYTNVEEDHAPVQQRERENRPEPFWADLGRPGGQSGLYQEAVGEEGEMRTKMPSLIRSRLEVFCFVCDVGIFLRDLVTLTLFLCYIKSHSFLTM